MIAAALLVASTSFVFAANNIGMIKTSFQSITGRAESLYLLAVIAGFSAGFLVEGYKVSGIVSGDVVSLSSYQLQLAILSVFLVMLIFTLLRLPASMSNVMLGAILGPALALSIPFSAERVLLVIFAWLVAPLTSAALAVILYRLYRLVVLRMSLKHVSAFNRYSGICVTVFSAYTLSANNLGLLLGFPGGDSTLILVSSILGIVLLNSVIVSTLGWKMAILSPTAYSAALLSGSLTLWLYTQASIPASITQTVVSGMMALSAVSRPSIVNYRTMFEILGSWPFFLILSIGISFFFTYAFR